ncbi:hypothetical protein Q7P37_010880 [Cladosporium fusiforme]
MVPYTLLLSVHFVGADGEARQQLITLSSSPVLLFPLLFLCTMLKSRDVSPHPQPRRDLHLFSCLSLAAAAATRTNAAYRLNKPVAHRPTIFLRSAPTSCLDAARRPPTAGTPPAKRHFYKTAMSNASPIRPRPLTTLLYINRRLFPCFHPPSRAFLFPSFVGLRQGPTSYRLQRRAATGPERVEKV